ncbi:phosphate signaling complex PhoU family protein [Pyrococcus abyssi]|uniref:Phosphate regulatory protein, putative n=1 Tax=Pyrococcus abyssi (strain GE5 / Orsay) TaxID=272844 RepID=Q9V263_PYRAB|nr:phosphate uptake regulator PhoU [Pyrococcus abyssi]CAB49135.1 Phosphate uptake regulator, phoU family [Pyrococcus abyssi GE5]CCE69587.1 TPA: phosphate regulatory protein, putative [Pyrococcus abyssi GE5]
MEFRKIQFTGRSSYIVSLPKAWIKEHGLKRGDTVSLVLNPDGSITIFPGKYRERQLSRKLKITRDYSPDMAIRLVISAYIQGYDTIEIELEEEMPLYKVAIRKTLQSLPGVEIVFEEQQRIVAKSLLDEEEINLVELLKRMSAIVTSMFSDLELIIQGQNGEVLRDIKDLENELDRFYFLIMRAVNRLLSKRGVTEESGLFKKPFDLIGILLIARNVERIGDHIIRIAENPDYIDVKYLLEKFHEMMAQVEAMDLYKVDKLMMELGERAKNTDYRKSISMDSYRRILEYLENIGEVIINMAIG